jgi:chemotaxis protein methyltransferase CheR
MRGPFDIIFCRNVMIYFDQAVRQRVIGAMEGLLRTGGYLLIGHSEALSGIQFGLRMVRPSVFLKPRG